MPARHPDGGASESLTTSWLTDNARSPGTAVVVSPRHPKRSFMSEINDLAPQIMTEVEGCADTYPYPSFLMTVWLILQSYFRTMLGLRPVTEVAQALRHKSYPPYYLRPFHSQPAGYLCPVASSTFDRTFGYIFGKHVPQMQAQLAASLGDVGTGTVVDLGSGTSSLFHALRRQLPDAKLVGVELSPYMLAMAQRNTQALSNVELLEGDLCDTPLSNGCADAVAVCFVFHELPRAVTERALCEAHRLLAPGGRLVILDTVIEASWIARVFHAIYIHMVHEPYAEAYAKAPLHDMFRAAGFEHLETRYLARATGLRVWRKLAAA